MSEHANVCETGGDTERETASGDTLPSGFRRLASGAVYDTARGRIVSNPGNGPYALTPARLREIHVQRAERRLAAEKAARRGMARAAGATALQAVENIAAAQYALAVDPSAKRASTEAARFLLEAGGLSGAGGRDGGDGDAGGVTLRLGADVARQILEIAAARRSGEGGG